MRHATDPDHVIAVSTIVSRERSLSKAMLIGTLWGLGHTITIVLVGAAIILFNVVIPPRIGLTMEFAVGLMLILLGVLNLSGVTKWMSEKFSPAHHRGTRPYPREQRSLALPLAFSPAARPPPSRPSRARCR
jgi:high-affinity nickel permease